MLKKVLVALATGATLCSPVAAYASCTSQAVQVYQNPTYTTQQVWVNPVTEQRTVTEQTTVYPPSVAFSGPSQARDIDTLHFDVRTSDPQGFAIGAYQWTVNGPNGTTVSNTPPTQLPPGEYQISLKVQNRAPDGTLLAWSDPYTQNLLVVPSVIANIQGVQLTNIVHPPVYTALPVGMPTSAPVPVKSGYDVTMHVASQGAGTLTAELYTGGNPISIGQGGSELPSLVVADPDGGTDVTFYIPSDKVSNGSDVDVKFTLNCRDPLGYGTSSVRLIQNAFVIRGSANSDVLVNRTE